MRLHLFLRAVPFVQHLAEDASAQGIGFSAVISMGNKAVMSEVDILKILACKS